MSPAPTRPPSALTIPSKWLVLQVAVRALRRVHLEYQAFGLGYQVDDPAQCRLLNHSAGVESAHELAVAAAFVQEFHTSKVAHGWMRAATGGKPPERRMYRIEHEHRYRSGTTKKGKAKYQFVDAVIWRVDEDGDCRDWGILPIEMKRAIGFQKELSTGSLCDPVKNSAAVTKDIEKLLKFKAEWEKHQHRDGALQKHVKGADVFPHLLVWGRVTDGTADSFLKKACKAAGTKLDTSKMIVDYVPLSWRDPKKAEWLWVAYAEVGS